MHRRLFLEASLAAWGLGAIPLRAQETLPLRRAKRPEPPYRVWFQPRCFDRDISLYRHMTIDASGWLDPRLCELAGKTGLRWVYGTNHPDAEDASYWREECSEAVRTVPSDQPEFVSAGVAIDEWIPPERPELEAYIADGLRAAREADPDIFIAVWLTDLRPPLAELMHDGTVDLGIVEGYTHTPPRFGPHAWLAWPTCLRRCEDVKDADLLDKTIFCFGHITDEANAKGEHLQADWLEEKTHEIKDRYPTMPGIAFYQSTSPDTPELRHLVQHCDRLSGKLWP